MINRNELDNYLNQFFKVNEYEDYCPNGLQIEGKQEIKSIAFAVSATRESINEAVLNKVDALIVHHGLFWKFHGPKTLTGSFYKRVAPLIKENINLFAYHLPLDGHLEIGNAIGLAKKIELLNTSNFGEYKKSNIGIKGELKSAVSAKDFEKNLSHVLNRNVIYSIPTDFPDKMIKTVGIITGGANSSWVEAKKEKLDAYITGEMSEHDFHDSSESNIYMFAGGHHATERFGVLALEEHLKSKYKGLKTYFFDSSNPA